MRCYLNFDYIMSLNVAAGRSLGDSANHPVFRGSQTSRHLLGLARAQSLKFRLAKGDAQLELTYRTSLHHIPENLRS